MDMTAAQKKIVKLEDAVPTYSDLKTVEEVNSDSEHHEEDSEELRKDDKWWRSR